MERVQSATTSEIPGRAYRRALSTLAAALVSINPFVRIRRRSDTPRGERNLTGRAIQLLEKQRAEAFTLLGRAPFNPARLDVSDQKTRPVGVAIEE